MYEEVILTKCSSQTDVTSYELSSLTSSCCLKNEPVPVQTIKDVIIQQLQAVDITRKPGAETDVTRHSGGTRGWLSQSQAVSGDTPPSTQRPHALPRIVLSLVML